MAAARSLIGLAALLPFIAAAISRHDLTSELKPSGNPTVASVKIPRIECFTDVTRSFSRGGEDGIGSHVFRAMAMNAAAEDIVADNPGLSTREAARLLGLLHGIPQEWTLHRLGFQHDASNHPDATEAAVRRIVREVVAPDMARVSMDLFRDAMRFMAARSELRACFRVARQLNHVAMHWFTTDENMDYEGRRLAVEREERIALDELPVAFLRRFIERHRLDLATAHRLASALDALQSDDRSGWGTEQVADPIKDALHAAREAGGPVNR